MLLDMSGLKQFKVESVKPQLKVQNCGIAYGHPPKAEILKLL